VCIFYRKQMAGDVRNLTCPRSGITDIEVTANGPEHEGASPIGASPFVWFSLLSLSLAGGGGP